MQLLPMLLRTVLMDAERSATSSLSSRTRVSIKYWGFLRALKSSGWGCGWLFSLSLCGGLHRVMRWTVRCWPTHPAQILERASDVTRGGVLVMAAGTRTFTETDAALNCHFLFLLLFILWTCRPAQGAKEMLGFKLASKSGDQLVHFIQRLGWRRETFSWSSSSENPLHHEGLSDQRLFRLRKMRGLNVLSIFYFDCK